MTPLSNLDSLFQVPALRPRKHHTLCVRWYLCYKLKYRDLVETMAERGFGLAPHHSAVLNTGRNPAIEGKSLTGQMRTVDYRPGNRLLAGSFLLCLPRVGLRLMGWWIGRRKK